MGFNRECMEWFTELLGDFGFSDDDATQDTHIMYYRLIVASKRLALLALANPRIEPDLERTARQIVAAKLGMDPEDQGLQDLADKLKTTEELVRPHEN